MTPSSENTVHEWDYLISTGVISYSTLVAWTGLLQTSEVVSDCMQTDYTNGATALKAVLTWYTALSAAYRFDVHSLPCSAGSKQVYLLHSKSIAKPRIKGLTILPDPM